MTVCWLPSKVYANFNSYGFEYQTNYSFYFLTHDWFYQLFGVSKKLTRHMQSLTWYHFDLAFDKVQTHDFLIVSGVLSCYRFLWKMFLWNIMHGVIMRDDCHFSHQEFFLARYKWLKCWLFIPNVWELSLNDYVGWQTIVL